MTSMTYDPTRGDALKGALPDLTAAGTTVKVMLVTNNYSSLSQSTAQQHHFKSEVDAVSGGEASGTGYTAGGQALANKTYTLDTTAHKAYAGADNPSWASSTITATGAIFYVDTGTASTSRLLRYVDFGGSRSSTNGAFTLQLPADGFFYVN